MCALVHALSGIGCYGFCLVLLVLVYSRVRLGLFAYVSCFVLFWFWLCYGRLSVSRCFLTSGNVSFRVVCYGVCIVQSEICAE